MGNTLISPDLLGHSKRPKAQRGTYFVQTWGCQMNEEDSQQLALRLESIGFGPADSLHTAHVILLNTCSVRKKPEDKAFSLLGELSMLKDKRPEIVIGVCGCMAQLRSDEIHRRAPHVDFVVGTGQIASVAGLVEEALQTRRFQSRLELPERKGAVVEDVPNRLLPSWSGAEANSQPSPRSVGMSDALLSRTDTPGTYESEISNLRSQISDSQNETAFTSPIENPESNIPTPESRIQTHESKIQTPHSGILNPESGIQNPKSKIQNPKLKAFVPIQYGCDKFCAFCIVPTTRGRERSRPTAEIVAEVRALSERGTQEVTLLGQTVNSYGKNLAEGRVPFSKLLWLLDGLPKLERIRYTSPYPRDFTPDLIACIRDCGKVMEHVHLPLQSGDDAMLKAMRRVYTVDGFLKIVSDLREAVPGIGLTTDIIVGYPEETEEQYEHTLAIVRQVRFDGAYMFIYSPRPGTPAADLPQLSREIKTARLKRLAELQNAISCEINEAYVGKSLEILVEGPSPKNPALLQGYSREFKMVHFAGPKSWTGEKVVVRAMEPHLWGLTGRAE